MTVSVTRFCVFLFAIATAVSVCARETQFEPEKFFAGRTRSSGVFRNNIGKPQQHFTTECRGRVLGSTLRLDQSFRYDDGRRQERHWEIRRLDANHYRGRANDVVGEARGEVAGSIFHFKYIVALKPGNPLFNVQLDQTMMLRQDGLVENHATIRKLGFPLSRIIEKFRRVK